MNSLLVVLTSLTLSWAAPFDFGVPVLDGRIVGGESASIEDYPYQASLRRYSTQICGAVVISEDYVLTAAHCTYDYTAEILSVRAGSTFRSTGGIVVQVSTIHQHPRYDNETSDYDLTVLKLASRLPFGSTIAPIALPTRNQRVTPGDLAYVSGWGYLVENGTSANHLQVVQVPMISVEECREAYGYDNITERMVCAGYPQGGRDACQGDSGGPLVVKGVLIGLVSGGEGCARPGYPGVYASVPYLRDYISSITGL